MVKLVKEFTFCNPQAQEYREYQAQVLKNTSTMAKSLISLEYSVVSGEGSPVLQRLYVYPYLVYDTECAMDKSLMGQTLSIQFIKITICGCHGRLQDFGSGGKSYKILYRNSTHCLLFCTVQSYMYTSGVARISDRGDIQQKFTQQKLLKIF